ncbi:hypothetical protein ABZ540_14810 [Nocardia xishanensis]|uniref:hypothetical protein n=1 Tax=Nocardia xishanensis TaxID=238964 RepID=UPI00340F6478
MWFAKRVSPEPLRQLLKRLIILDRYGILVGVHSSTVRQCLQQLSIEEVEELLASSSSLREAVREAASKPKGIRMDSRMFLLWVSMPTASDPLLQGLPKLYAREIRERAGSGDTVAPTVGVRAMLALDSNDMTLGRFKELLAEFRAAPSPELEFEPLQGAQQANVGVDLAHIVTALDSEGVGEMIAGLREASEAAAEQLSVAAEDVRAGRFAPSVQDVVSGWNSKLASGWKMLGVPEVGDDASFGSLEQIRDRLADHEREAARVREQAVRKERQARLEQLQTSAAGLEPLIAEDAFRIAYERALEEIAELEAEGELPDVSNGLDGIDDGGANAGDVVTDVGLKHGTTEGVEHEAAGIIDGTSTGGARAASVVTMDNVAADVETADTNGDVVAAPQSISDDTRMGQNTGADRQAVVVSTSADDSPASSGYAPTDPADRGGAPVVCTDGTGEQTTGLSDCVDDLVQHVRKERFGAAWLVARAAGLSQLDTQAYRLAAEAFNCAPGGIDPAHVLIGLTTMLAGQEFSTAQSAKVALAATVRAGLAAGWIPRSELETIARQANLETAWRNLIDAAIAAGDRNYQHLHDFGGRPDLSIDDAQERARSVRAELAGQRINYARADKVRKYLLGPQRPLGAVFEAIFDSTTGDERRLALTAALARLESPDEVIESADHAVSTPQQLRRHIEAHARLRLRKAVESVLECGREALNATVVVAADSRVAVAQEARRDLVAAARAARAELEALGPGDVALDLLAGWIIKPEPPTRITDGLQVLIEASLPVTCADRDDDGLPIIDPCNRGQVVAELRAPRPAQELFDAFISRGDLQQATAVSLQAHQLQVRLGGERSEWARRLCREVDAVRAEVGRTYADDFNQAARATAEARLVTPAQYTGDRFDLQMRDLRQLSDDLADHRQRTAKILRGRVGDEITDNVDRDRITALIDADDFVGANELLALARSGTLPSPEDDDSPVGAHVFESFSVALSTSNLGTPTTIRDVVAQFGGGRSGSEAPIEHGDMTRLAHWDNLLQKGNAGRGSRQTTLGSILRALGLDTRGEISRDSAPGVRHFERYRVTATPVDGSLVPGLGSRATHYMVVATADHKLLRETLSKGFPTKNGPNIVLFAGVLTMDQRRQCLSVCREQKISAIVVDQAVAAFVAARYPRSFRAVQQITLPFTCFTHYTVVAGNVPDEVFVGRADELATLTDRADSLFVYGGRQLGKSALLRKIQRDFNSEPDHRAIFIDLNSHGIGTWADSQRLWPVLYNELAQVGGMDVKPNSAVRLPDPVIRAIRQWLNGKESRRLLLLLDEADAFLEKESSRSSREFENIGPLKGLFDDTQGRFKPVFAGLHKVQRLQNVANTPLAHGGRDVLIGPLAAKPASDLVMKPLEALGYRFGNPEAVWRLLAFTNLQPGLIQVVCNDLIAHLQARPLHKGEPLITINDADIDAVTQDQRTRDKIAEKLRLTIALEDRYRVIALAVAIMCMEDEFREKYTAADIREHCEVYWQQGFEDLNSAEFEVYLDELVGLGVLIKDPDGRFSVRSPNIVTMLGTKEQLETELDENKEQFELPHEYNPRSTRRRVTVADTTVRSPISEHDLSRLVPVKAKYDPAGNFVIVGSEALGITDVARVLKSVSEERAVNVTVLDAVGDDVQSQLSEFKFAGGGNSAPRLLVVDASCAVWQQAAAISTAVRAMRKRERGHLVVVYGADGIAAARDLHEASGEVETTLINLAKWSGDGIRSWHDNPFNTPGDRRELLTHSGGWPELVERAVADVSNRGISHAEAWERVSDFPENKAAATGFLRSAGVGDYARGVLFQWAELGSTTYERIADIADVLDRDQDDMHAMASDLAALGVLNEYHDEYAIDPVVVRALSRLA